MNSTSQRIRVVLAEDHQVVAEGIVALLQSMPDIDVVELATDGRSAYEAVMRHCPDVVITDIGLPVLNGIELIRKIRKDLPDVRILALSMHDDAQFVYRATRAGAMAYVLKGSGVFELRMGIYRIMEGKTYFSSGLPVDPVSEAGRPSRPSDLLTDREREVLQLVAEGYTAKEIATELSVSPRTVENHRANIMDRLGIRTIAGLVRYAIKNGISLE